jgi:cell division cycle protein 37
MTSRTIDYSVWDHIEVSDDEDETHPNIDTPSLFRWRHQARVEKQVAFEEKGEELERNMAECKRRLEEVQYRVKELEEEGKKEGEEERKTALSKAQAEEKKYRKDQRLWEKKMEEHRREEKKMPWNVDTLSKEGFSKSILNIKPEVTEETEEQKEEKHQTFVDKHKKEIKHFGEFQHHTTKPFNICILHFSLSLSVITTLLSLSLCYNNTSLSVCYNTSLCLSVITTLLSLCLL